jgi:hypothetical protein
VTTRPTRGHHADSRRLPNGVNLTSEMIKTRVPHGYCSRHLAAEACPYADICENFDNYQTDASFLPQRQEQLADAQALQDDAVQRGWDSKVARHARLIASLQRHVNGLKDNPPMHSEP